MMASESWTMMVLEEKCGSREEHQNKQKIGGTLLTHV